MGPLGTVLALLAAGVAAGAMAKRLPPSGKVALLLALVPLVGFYYALAPC